MPGVLRSTPKNTGQPYLFGDANEKKVGVSITRDTHFMVDREMGWWRAGAQTCARLYQRLTFNMKAGKARLGSADHSFGSTGLELSTGATIRCTNRWAEVTSALRMSASSRRAVKVLQTHDRGPRLEVVLSVRDEGGHHTASFIKRPASGR